MATIIDTPAQQICEDCTSCIHTRIEEREASFITILDNIPDSVFSVDRNYRLLTANKSFREKTFAISGINFRPGDTLLLKGKYQHVINQWRPYVQEAMKGKAFKVEMEFVVDGNTYHREASFSPIQQAGEIIGVSCYSKDISDIKIAEKRLEERKMLFRTLLENSHDGIAMLSAGGRLKYISPSVSRILGYSFEEMSEIGTANLVHPNDLPAIINFVDELIPKYGEAGEIYYRMKSKKGDWRWVHCHYTNLLHEPSIKALVVNYEDVTEQRELEIDLENTVHNLIQADERQSSIINSLRANIALLNQDGIIIEVNEAWKRFADDNQLVSKNYGVGDNYIEISEKAACAGEKSGSEVANGIRDVLVGKVAEFSMEYTCHSDTEKRWFKVKVYPLYKKKRGGVVVYHVDITERKLADLQIEFHRRNQDALINSTSDPMWSITPDMRLITANNAFLSVAKDRAGIDLKPGDTMLFAVTYPVDYIIEYWTKQYNRVLSGETFTEVIHRVRPSDYWAEISFNPIWEDGKVIGAACYLRDITESKEAERLLLQSQQMMSDAESIAHFGSWEHDLHNLDNLSGNPLRWSDEVFRIFGYEPGRCEVNTENFYKAVHPDDREPLRQTAQKAIEENTGFTMNHRIIRPDGEVRWVREEAKIILNESTDKPIKKVGTVLDITERKAAEDKLLEAERNYREIFDKASDAIFVLDVTAGKIVDTNLMGCELTGFSKEEILNGNFEMFIPFIPGYCQEDAMNHIEKTITEGPQIFEWHTKHKDGSLNWNEVNLTRATIAGCDRVLAFFRNIDGRKQAEEKLRSSEEQYRQIVETAQEGIIVLDANNRIAIVNDKMCEMLEYTQEEILGKEIFDFLDEEMKEQSLSGINRRRRGEAETVERRHLTKTGRYIWTNISASPIFGKAGEYNGTLAMLTDITDRKLTEESMRMSNERYELVTKATNDAIWDWNLLTGELYWTEGYETLFGYSREEAGSSFDTCTKHIHPEDLEQVMCLCQKRIDDPSSHSWRDEFRFMRSNGSIANVYNRGYIIRNEEGLAVRMVGAMQDITARKLTEESLRLNNERYELATRASNDAIWDWNLVTDERFWSEAYESIFGYSREGGGVNLLTTISRIHPDDRERISTSWSKTLSDPTTHSWGEEYRYLRADGTVANVYNRGYIVYDETGKPVRMVGALQDISARKIAEEQLRLSNERYELATKATNDAIWDWNLLTDEVYWSQGYENLFGYPRDINAKSNEIWTKRIHPDDVERIWSAVNKEIHDWTSHFWQGEYRYMKYDGSIANVYDRGYIIYNEDGTPIRMVGAMQDVTSQMLAEESLRLSNERYELATKATNDAIWDWNLLTGNLHWTDGYEILFGYSREKDGLSFDTCTGRIHPDDAVQVRIGLQRKMNDPHSNSWQAEYRYRKSDGTYANVFNQAYIIRNKEGLAIRMVGAMQDFSARKKAEESLLKSEANLRTIFDHADRAYVLLDKDFRILSFNTVATEWAKLVYNAEFKEGESIITYLEADKKEEGKRILESVLEGHHLVHEAQHNAPDGTEKWFSVRRYPVRNEDGSILGICIASKEITQRRQFQMERDKMTAEIVQRNKDLEQYAYIVSHNLRAPVANIVGFSDALLHTDLNKAEKQDVLDGLDISIKRLDNVIMDLNSILQVKKEVNGMKETIRLSRLVDDIALSIGNTIAKEHVVVKTDFEQVDELFTLKSYMHSIFYNLISNSIKYRNPDVPPIIEIKSRRLEDKIELCFSDNGLGIDLQKKNGQVFGLYKRFHTEVAEGKGMGLFMVKAQVESLGGKITVESEVNMGTAFRIVFER